MIETCKQNKSFLEHLCAPSFLNTHESISWYYPASANLLTPHAHHHKHRCTRMHEALQSPPWVSWNDVNQRKVPLRRWTCWTSLVRRKSCTLNKCREVHLPVSTSRNWFKVRHFRWSPFLKNPHNTNNFTRNPAATYVRREHLITPPVPQVPHREHANP